jgi:uncharacterized Zn finger protein (UPF0148 family)
MAETLVENQICKDCGAVVRSQALFCYNCGGAVAEEKSVNNSKQKGKSSRKYIVEEKNRQSNLVKDLNNFPEEIEDDEQNEELSSTEGTSKTKENKKVKLKSAAALRNKTRRLEPKKVEIIWEEHENAPNLWFLMVAGLLVVFTIVIYFIAMSLK